MEPDQEKQEKLKEKFMQFRTLHQYIEQIGEHLQLLHMQHTELENTKEALLELGGTSQQEMLAPLANGIFVKAKLLETENVLINVGADIVVEKAIPQAIEMLEAQQKETAEKIGQAQKLKQEFNQQAVLIYKEIEALQ